MSGRHGRFIIRDSGGSGHVLVFLCDPPVTVEAYDELIAAFDRQYRAIVLELPGFGFSKALSAEAVSFQGAVEAIEKVLMALGIKACVLFDSCICGFVAVEPAKRGRLPFRGVVLMQTPDRAGMLAWWSRT